MAEGHLRKIRDLFDRYDSDKDDSLDLNELALMLQEISSKIMPLPAVRPFFLLCKSLYSCYAALSRLHRSHRSKENTSERNSAS